MVKQIAELTDLEQEQIKWEEELLVNKIIFFLSPHFKISPNVDDAEWKKFIFPEVKFCYGKVAHYFPYLPPKNNHPKIILPYEIGKRHEGILAHEVGHWFHNFINLETYEFITGFCTPSWNFKLKEGVADYAEIIYPNKSNPIINPRFSLSQLARMSLEEAKTRQEEISDFVNNEIRPKIPDLSGGNL